MSRTSISLNDACSPLFLFLTTFRRNSETSSMSMEELHERLDGTLAEIKRRCDEDERLHKLLKKVRYALVTAADQVVLSSKWSGAMAWGVDLWETRTFGSAEGGHRFFELCEEVLSKRGSSASEVAEVLFQCMSLGFQGELLGERKKLDRLRNRLFEKARLAGSIGEAMTPQAYGRNMKHPGVKLPTVRTARVLVLLGALAIALVISVGWGAKFVYGDFVAKAEDSARELQSTEGTAEATSAATEGEGN